MKKISESMQVRYTPWDVFGIQLQGRMCAPLVQLSVGVETWPYSSSELLSVKLSKTISSTSEKSDLFLPALYFVPRGKKPGMYSLGRKDKKEKLYRFGNDLAEFLQDSGVLHLSIAKIKLLTHVYRGVSNPP